MNLPRTDFAMRANLPENEPKRLKFWNDIDIYHKVLEKNKDNSPLFCMMDLLMQMVLFMLVMRLTRSLKTLLIKAMHSVVISLLIFLVGTVTVSQLNTW